MGSGNRSTLVRICDPAGRQRGTGFVADDRGTVVTSHEAVDGLLRLVLYGKGDRSCLVEADAITNLPELDLALVRTGGLDALGVEPLPVALRDRIEAGTYVRVAAHGWREARVLGVAPVTYTATDRSYRVGAAMELALGTDGRDALRLRGAAVGGPVLDPDSGAVIAVVGTALRGGHSAAGFAVPLVGAGTVEPLGELLRRNATTVPGYGRDLNLAGALQLAAMSIGAAAGPGAWPDPVERPDITAEFTAFTASGERPAVVLGLVAEPGTGRTTELAALAARRARGCDPALTLWLRGADLLADDASVADAIARTLEQAGRGPAGPRTPARSATPPGGPLTSCRRRCSGCPMPVRTWKCCGSWPVISSGGPAPRDGRGSQEAPGMSPPAGNIADAPWGRTPSSDRGSGGGCGCPRRTASTCCGGWSPRTARRAEAGGAETATADGAGPARAVTRAGTAARSGSWMWWPGGSSPGPGSCSPCSVAGSPMSARCPPRTVWRCGRPSPPQRRRSSTPVVTSLSTI